MKKSRIVPHGRIDRIAQLDIWANEQDGGVPPEDLKLLQLLYDTIQALDAP